MNDDQVDKLMAKMLKGAKLQNKIARKVLEGNDLAECCFAILYCQQGVQRTHLII